MRRLVVVLLASVLAAAAVDAAQADSLQVTPQRQQPYNQYNGAPHGRDIQNNSVPAPGTSNRYFTDTLSNQGTIQGPAFTNASGGWENLPCRIDVFSCF